MINTLGGRFGGHGLYLLKGKPVFVYNSFDSERFRWEGQAALTPGKHTIVFDFKYDGPGFGKGGTGVLSVDDKDVARKTIPHTIPFVETIDETFDVGVDTRTGVDDKRLPGAVPVHRQAGEADGQAGPSEGCGGKAAPAKGPRDKKQGTVNRSASVVLRTSARLGVNYLNCERRN